MKRINTLLAVFLAVAFASGITLQAVQAAEDVQLTGQIVKIDHATGEITVNIQGKDETLKVEPEMIKDLKIDTKVKIVKQGEKVVSVKPARVTRGFSR